MAQFFLDSLLAVPMPTLHPLPQGCLAPVRVVIPKGSILDPSSEAAVVGGNVLTSQRVVDVILAAFGACAASQVRLGAGVVQRGGVAHGVGVTQREHGLEGGRGPGC